MADLCILGDYICVAVQTTSLQVRLERQRDPRLSMLQRAKFE